MTDAHDAAVEAMAAGMGIILSDHWRERFGQGFAALTESEAVQVACGRALAEHYADNPWQTFHHEPSVAAVVLAALAPPEERGQRA